MKESERPKGKSLKDLEGWSQSISMKSIFPWREGYSLFISPDKKRIAQVDLGDDEVTVIWNRSDKKIEYIHPVTERGMKRLGITFEQLSSGMRESDKR